MLNWFDIVNDIENTNDIKYTYPIDIKDVKSPL